MEPSAVWERLAEEKAMRHLSLPSRDLGGGGVIFFSGGMRVERKKTGAK